MNKIQNNITNLIELFKVNKIYIGFLNCYLIDNNGKFLTTRSGTLPYLAPECARKKTELCGKSCYKIDMFAFILL